MNWCIHRYDDILKGAWRYYECRKCGRRYAERWAKLVYGPVDTQWLETGEWSERPTTPPKRPTTVWDGVED